MSQVVYVIGTAWDQPIKIGVATNVEFRLQSLQAGNPARLTVLWCSGAIDGPFAVEAAMHATFKAHRLAGEWFAIPDASIALIAKAFDEANARPRDTIEASYESQVASRAAKLLVRRRIAEAGCSHDAAMRAVARSASVTYTTMWKLHYRVPKEIGVSVYARLAKVVATAVGRWPLSDAPDADDLAAMIDALMASPLTLAQQGAEGWADTASEDFSD